MKQLFFLLLGALSIQPVFADSQFDLGTAQSSHIIDGGMRYTTERVTRNSTQFVDGSDIVHSAPMQLQPIPEHPNIMYFTVNDSRFLRQPHGWIDLSSERHVPFSKRWYYHVWAELPD